MHFQSDHASSSYSTQRVTSMPSLPHFGDARVWFPAALPNKAL